MPQRHNPHKLAGPSIEGIDHLFLVLLLNVFVIVDVIETTIDDLFLS